MLQGVKDNISLFFVFCSNVIIPHDFHTGILLTYILLTKILFREGAREVV